MGVIPRQAVSCGPTQCGDHDLLRANHANILACHHTTEIDGEEGPYSVTGSERVCSSCVEVFNVITDDSRKLVNACPGSVTFGGAKRDLWLDVKPTNRGNEGAVV